MSQREAGVRMAICWSEDIKGKHAVVQQEWALMLHLVTNTEYIKLSYNYGLVESAWYMVEFFLFLAVLSVLLALK